MRTLLLIALLGIAVPAAAQERRVPLKRGESVIELIRREAGCSRPQAERIWRLVIHDSGLEPIDDLYVPAGFSILLKRDCNGRELARVLRTETSKPPPPTEAEPPPRETLQPTPDVSESPARPQYYWWVPLGVVLVLALLLGLEVLRGRKVTHHEPEEVFRESTEESSEKFKKEDFTWVDLRFK